MSNIDNYTEKLEISYSGNKNSAVTVVNSLTITQGFKRSYLTPKINGDTKTFTWMFTAALFIKAKMQQKTQMLLTDKCIFKMQCIYCCSVSQSCKTLCDPKDCSMPGFSVLHHLPELAQIHVHGVGDGIQLSHSLSSTSPPAFNLSQHQNLFQWVTSLHQEAKILELQLQHRLSN